MAAAIKAMIHLEGPVKNKVIAIPANTELYPYKPLLILFAGAPPTFPINVPMMEDKSVMIPNVKEEIAIAIKIMTPETAFSMNRTWEIPLSETRKIEANPSFPSFSK